MEVWCWRNLVFLMVEVKLIREGGKYGLGGGWIC